MDDLKQVELDLDIKLGKLDRCQGCQHILAVKFQKRHLFFCRAQRGGRYGKKIAKRAVACRTMYQRAYTDIPVIDGYFGQQWTMKRGK